MEFVRSFLRRHFAGKPAVTSRNVGCFLRLGKKQTTEEEPYCVLPLNRVFIYFYLFAYSNFCCSSGYVSLVGGPLMTLPLHVIPTAS